jgi:hypothetical protein
LKLLLLPACRLLFFPLCSSGQLFLPELFLSLLNQVHQLFVKVFLLTVICAVPSLRGFHVLFVHRAGDVVGVLGQAHHCHSANFALMSAVPGEGGGQWAFNGSFGHGSGKSFLKSGSFFVACRAFNYSIERLYFLVTLK